MEDQYESEEALENDQKRELISKLRDSGFKVKEHPRYIQWVNDVVFARARIDTPQRLHNTIDRINNELLIIK